jgi:peptidyl-prolyl cis-trans isomerase B (cyclophilin B)
MLAVRRLPLLALLVVVAGCSLPRGTVAPPTPVADPAQERELELRALLMLLEDRGLFEPTVMGQAFASSDPETRVTLARALGRIDDPRCRDVLLELLVDPQPAIRAAAAAGLARHPGAVVEASLLGVAGDDDPDAAIAALDALARLGVSLDRVLDGLERLGGDEMWRRLLPALFRFGAEERFEAASLALLEAPPELRSLAGLALAWRPPARAAGSLRELLGADDPFVRAAAARALGAVGEAADLAKLVALLAEPQQGPQQGPRPEVVAGALAGAAGILERGLAAAPASWRGPLLGLFSAGDPALRLAVIEGSAAWLLDDQIEQALDRRVLDPQAPAGERVAALLALARGGAEAAPDRAADAAISPDPFVRAGAARAAGTLGLPVLMRGLAADADAGVRAAALESAFRLAEEPLELARAARADPSAAVRGTLFELLRERPLLGWEELVRPAGGASLERERAPASRRSLVLALEARGGAERLERGAILEVLETVAGRDPERPVRVAARGALARLGGEPPPERAPAGRQELQAYREIAARGGRAVELVVVTERGRIGLLLPCRATPKTCVSLVQLARQGFYDGQRVETLEPGAQILFGDPTRTGFGDAGYRLLAERSPAALVTEPGQLVLDCAYPGGCATRLRLTLGPQPGLGDSGVPLGRVTSGLDVLRALGPGDRIETVEVVD